MNKKFKVIVFFICLINCLVLLFVFRTEYLKMIPKKDLELSSYDLILKTLNDDKFEDAGAVEYSAMEKESASTYDHKTVWNVMRIRSTSETPNIYSMNDYNVGRAFSYLRDRKEHYGGRGIIHPNLKDEIEKLEEDDLVYVKWKNFRVDRYMGISVMDDIRKATHEEVVEYLKVERKFDEERFGPYEEPEYNRFLYKLKTHPFEKIGVIQNKKFDSPCSYQENNYIIAWSLFKFQELFEKGIKFQTQENGQFAKHCYSIVPEVFEKNPSCLIPLEHVDTFKRFSKGDRLYSSWKILRIHKKHCFTVLDEVRIPTPEEIKQYEEMSTPGGEYKVGKYGKYFK